MRTTTDTIPPLAAPPCSAFPPSISNLARAKKAVDGGASLAKCSFFRGGQGYTGILTTKRGKQYAVPHRIMAIISLPNTHVTNPPENLIDEESS